MADNYDEYASKNIFENKNAAGFDAGIGAKASRTPWRRRNDQTKSAEG
ncbi:MAG: hypothetical protein AB7S74_09520 [Hyphomicrobium sp.]|nr:hypothetical protein [Hyphomicrobium sp.]